MARSIKKGPFIDESLLKKIRIANETVTKKIIKTWSRRSTIVPELIGYTVAVHNGKKFIKKFSNLLRFLVPLYEKEGRAYLTIAIGCTGGKHRSVAIINELDKSFDKEKYMVSIRHRDIEAL